MHSVVSLVKYTTHWHSLTEHRARVQAKKNTTGDIKENNLKTIYLKGMRGTTEPSKLDDKEEKKRKKTRQDKTKKGKTQEKKKEEKQTLLMIILKVAEHVILPRELRAAKLARETLLARLRIVWAGSPVSRWLRGATT